MKKEINKKEVEEKEIEEQKINPKDNLKTISILLGITIIIIALIIFLSLNNNKEQIPNTFTYNNHHFAKVDDGLWSFGINYNEQLIGILIHNTPLHLEKIEVIGDLKSFLPSNKTYLSYQTESWDNDPSLKIALGDFGVKLAGLAPLIQGNIFFDPTYVCTVNNDDVCNTIGTINCDNEDEKVIMFIEDKITYITIENNCIKIHAKKNEFIKGTDRILYSWFNIMD
jgi:hypothetical protein